MSSVLCVATDLIIKVLLLSTKGWSQLGRVQTHDMLDPTTHGRLVSLLWTITRVDRRVG
jgi:hypothetical protein